MILPHHQRKAIGGAAFVAAAGAAVLLVVAAVFDAKAAAAGWLIGFAFWAQILVGCLALLMIHRLTGGRWGELAAPIIGPTAAAMPLLIVLAIPLFIAIPALYPWSHHPDAIKPDVLSYYLNTPGFIVRTVLALAGWTALAILLPRNAGARGRLLAALGLVFHAVVISSVSIDWYLSLEAPFTSSSFGASVAISSLVAALAWTAVLAQAPAGDPAIGDLGALLLATVLGITYIDFMAVLVIWYGDLPREEAWFVARDRLPWSALAAAAFILVSLLPILALLLSRVRNASKPLRAVGLGILVGLACYDAYLIAPQSGALALLSGLVAIVAIGLGYCGILLSGVTARIASREPADAR
jgi:hypothetical protein